MALTRKFLTALGIDAEKIDEIIQAHTETVDGLKEQLKTAQAEAEKLPAVQKELDDLKVTAKADSAYRKKYDDEHAAFEKFKADTEAEKVLAAKKTAYKDVLKDAGITAEKSVEKVLKYTAFEAEKSVEKVLKYTAFDKMELDDSGKIKDAASLMKTVKEEWPELITTQGQQGAETGKPPANNGGSAFAAMSLAEKMQYANAHPGDKEVADWMSKPYVPAKNEKE